MAAWNSRATGGSWGRIHPLSGTIPTARHSIGIITGRGRKFSFPSVRKGDAVQRTRS